VKQLHGFGLGAMRIMRNSSHEDGYFSTRRYCVWKSFIAFVNAIIAACSSAEISGLATIPAASKFLPEIEQIEDFRLLERILEAIETPNTVEELRQVYQP